MTPQALAFIARFGATADEVAAATGISRWALLVQWAKETATGTQVFNQNNLGNIRCVAGIPCFGGFSQFPTLESFAQCAIATWKNGFYPDVLAKAGRPVRDQLLAIGACPWDAGRYGLAECGYAGCSLVALWISDFDSIDPLNHPPSRSSEMEVVSGPVLVAFGRGTDASGGGIWYHRSIDSGHAWSSWSELGPANSSELAGDLMKVVLHADTGKIDVFMRGSDLQSYRISSGNNLGASWETTWTATGGAFTGPLEVVGMPPTATAAPVDLTPVENAIAAVKAELDIVKGSVGTPVDLSSLEQTLANVQTVVTATKAQLSKDLA